MGAASSKKPGRKRSSAQAVEEDTDYVSETSERVISAASRTSYTPPIDSTNDSAVATPIKSKIVSRIRSIVVASPTYSPVASRTKSKVASRTRSIVVASRPGSPVVPRIKTRNKLPENSEEERVASPPPPRREIKVRKRINKESKYPRPSDFPYTKPKLVQPRNRKRMSPTRINITNYVTNYNCLDSKICRFPWKPIFDESGNVFALREHEVPILESDVTYQYQNYAPSMEHGPASRWEGARRQQEMMETRDTLKNCNKAMHLRFDYLKHKYGDSWQGPYF